MLFLLGRLAFAPAKNGRLGSETDANKIATLMQEVLLAIGDSWFFDICLRPPYSVEFPAVRRGTAAVRVRVDGDMVRFPEALLEDDALANAELVGPFYECFGDGCSDARIGHFLRRIFGGKGGASSSVRSRGPSRFPSRPNSASHAQHHPALRETWAWRSCAWSTTPALPPSLPSRGTPGWSTTGEQGNARRVGMLLCHDP